MTLDKDLISLKEAASLCNLSPQSLRTYINNGRLQGRKIAGVWLTTADWVREYIESRNPRGAKAIIMKKPEKG